MANVSNKLTTIKNSVNAIRTKLGVDNSTSITELANLISSGGAVYLGSGTPQQEVQSPTEGAVYIQYKYLEAPIETTRMETDFIKLPTIKKWTTSVNTGAFYQLNASVDYSEDVNKIVLEEDNGNIKVTVIANYSEVIYYYIYNSNNNIYELYDNNNVQQTSDVYIKLGQSIVNNVSGTPEVMANTIAFQGCVMGIYGYDETIYVYKNNAWAEMNYAMDYKKIKFIDNVVSTDGFEYYSGGLKEGSMAGDDSTLAKITVKTTNSWSDYSGLVATFRLYRYTDEYCTEEETVITFNSQGVYSTYTDWQNITYIQLNGDVLGSYGDCYMEVTLTYTSV